jgi:RNA polymerase sigma-70 factor (ECF subfamily)
VQESSGDLSALIRQAKRHDPDAWSALYQSTVTPVYRYLSARLNSIEEAEELTQEVFLAALAGIAGLRAHDEAGLLGWLFQITRHKLADHLRQRYRRPIVPLDEARAVEAADPDPQLLAEAGEARAGVQRALDQLTPEQREVIVYKYVLGYDNQRTAALLGKSVNAINQLHHRALASLHRLLTRAERVERST